MWIRVNSQRPLVVVLIGLCMVAWLALWLWGASPYGRFLTHEQLGEVHLGDNPLHIAVFVAGWTLMTVAMMLPTSLPLVVLFYGVIARRNDRLRLTVLLVAGYLGMWALFGVLVHLGDWVLHGVVEQIAWLEGSHWLIGSATLVIAGIYQFTPLKYKCLDKCRSPMSFILSHWRGRQEQAQALLLGVHHG